MFFGSVIVKLLGFIREWILYMSFGLEQGYSEYLALLAVVSIFVTTADVSFLNPIFYPVWNKIGVTNTLNTKTLKTLFLIVFVIFFYNIIFIQTSIPLFSQIIISLYVPIIYRINTIYSKLIFNNKIRNYTILLLINNLFYLAAAWVAIKTSIETLIILRLFVMVLTLLIGVQFLGLNLADVNNYKDNWLNPNSVFKIFKVNIVLFYFIVLKLVWSTFLPLKMAILNISIVISASFYSIIGKNINTLSLKEQIETKTTSKNTTITYFILSCFFLIFIMLLIFTLEFGSNYIQLLKRKDFKQIFIYVSLMSLSCIILGYLDLLNQTKIQEPLSGKKVLMGILIITFSMFILYVSG